MTVIATLVVGANDATTIAGSSHRLSTPPDRRRFLDLHRSAGAIITGKMSIESENYAKTEVPIFVLTRNSVQLTFTHPQMQQVTVNRNLADIARELDSRIEGNLVIEAGPELLQALITAGAVDQLQLSIVPIVGDDHFIDVELLLRDFLIESEEVIDGTRLLQCRYNCDSANS